jgi:hypothetical protein
LPELARQIRAERSQVAPAVRVFTNENIGQARAVLSSDTGSGPAADTTPAGEPSSGGRNEDQWRGLFDEARTSITRAETRVRLTEQELQTLNRRLLTESGLYNREVQLLPQITEKEAELEAARESVVSANEALANLGEELRRSGGPAGWSR